VLALVLLVNCLVLTCHGYEGCVSVRERESEVCVQRLHVSMSVGACV
jgi:hypothetical protein